MGDGRTGTQLGSLHSPAFPFGTATPQEFSPGTRKAHVAGGAPLLDFGLSVSCTFCGQCSFSNANFYSCYPTKAILTGITHPQETQLISEAHCLPCWAPTHQWCHSQEAGSPPAGAPLTPDEAATPCARPRSQGGGTAEQLWRNRQLDLSVSV